MSTMPATTFFEHYDITKGYGAYHLHLTRPVIDAVGESRPNHDVFHDLGVRLGLWDSDADDLGESGAGEVVAVGRHDRVREDRKSVV